MAATKKTLPLRQLVERPRIVSEVCRFHIVSLSQFYQYGYSFQRQKCKGLEELPPILQSFVHKISFEIRERIIGSF